MVENGIKGVSVWESFDRRPEILNYEELRAACRVSARAFEFRFASGMTETDHDLTRFGKNDLLDEWVGSQQGQSALVVLAKDIQDRICSHYGHALPAHDLRQILYKDAVEGLRFVEFEKPDGYKSSLVIPMFCHDIGRIMEGHFYKLGLSHKDWIPHSQLSFMMLKEVLDDHSDIPEALKNHFLYAVLAHSGQNASTYIGRAVQTCDRMQLIGPEGFFRAVSFVTGVAGGVIAYPRTPEYQTDLPALHTHNSAIAVLEHLGRNGYPNIGEKHFQWQQYMQTLNTAILLRLADYSPDLEDYLFSPEMNRIPKTSLGGNKKPLDLVAARSLLDELPATGSLYLSRQDIYERMLHTLETPIGAAALPERMKGNLRHAVILLKDDELEYVAHGMSISQKLQGVLDHEDDRLVRQILQSKDTSPLMKAIAEQAAPFARREPIRKISLHPDLVVMPRP